MTKDTYVTYCEECEAPVNKCICDKGPTFPPSTLDNEDTEDPEVCPHCGHVLSPTLPTYKGINQ